MTNQKNATTMEYRVTQARELYGAWREKGDVLSLTQEQAKYYLPPYGTGLVEVKPERKLGQSSQNNPAEKTSKSGS